MNSWSSIEGYKFESKNMVRYLRKKIVLKTLDRTLLRTSLIGLKQNVAVLFAHVYVHMHVFSPFYSLFLLAQVVDVTGNWKCEFEIVLAALLFTIIMIGVLNIY